MENILYYLLKVSVGTAVFYITYHFLFRKSKQFVFNRLYLAGSFLASFIIPLITFTRKTYITETTYYYIAAEPAGISETMTYIPETAASMGFHHYLLVLYFAGVLLFLSRLAWAFIVASRIRANSTVGNIAGMDINITRNNIRAFTFLDRIVIGQNILHHPSLNMVLVHEAVHSREKHFIDILVSEILFMLQWFNPFAWLKRKAIRNNLEFRADDVVARSFDPREYQLAMLSMAQNRVRSPLFIELNSSNLKKRIIMMKSNRQNRFSGIARLAIIPVSAILLLSLSGKETVIIRNTENVASQIDTAPSHQGSVPAQTDFTPLQQGIIASQITSAPSQQGSSVGSSPENTQQNTIQEASAAPVKRHDAGGHGQLLPMAITWPRHSRELANFDEIRKYLQYYMRYPVPAADAGKQGSVVIYGRINHEGWVEEASERTLSANYIVIEEPVVFGGTDGRRAYTSEPGLVREGKNLLLSLPRLDIPELQGKVIKVTFSWDLYNN